ncbi:hypothetical protein IMZ48_03040 [Candidatus Bathyarchaeota archaeon]|nr:hypothetical protein [Candidatus Bathyarchaeota archaeon]
MTPSSILKPALAMKKPGRTKRRRPTRGRYPACAPPAIGAEDGQFGWHWASRSRRRRGS